jgi:polyferredoxin
MTNDMKTRIEKAETRTAALSFVALVLLALLFVLGMYTNLYVEFPEGANGWEVIGTHAIAALHMGLGSAFALAAIGLLVAAIFTRRAVWISFSAIGVAASIAAAYGGTSFATHQSNGNSFVMALGFVVAFLSYAAGIYFGRTSR